MLLRSHSSFVPLMKLAMNSSQAELSRTMFEYCFEYTSKILLARIVRSPCASCSMSCCCLSCIM